MKKTWRILQNENNCITGPVSYTHLEVYKRQRLLQLLPGIFLLLFDLRYLLRQLFQMGDVYKRQAYCLHRNKVQNLLCKHNEQPAEKCQKAVGTLAGRCV